MIDEKDKKIIVALDENARLTTSQLAKTVQLSRPAITKRINDLIESKTITGSHSLVNHHKLGKHIFRTYVQFENDLEGMKAFQNAMIKDLSVFYMARLAGLWDYVIVTVADDSLEFYRWKSTVLAHHSKHIFSSLTGTLVSIRKFPFKFLGAKNYDHKVIGGQVTLETIDEGDRKILNTLSKNARQSATTIAHKLNISDDTVIRKIRTLEQKGIIVQHTIGVNVRNLGYEHYRAQIYLRNTTREQRRHLREYFKTHPRCIYYIACIAPWDIEVEFIVKNFTEYSIYMRTIRKEYAHIVKKVETVLIDNEWWNPNFSSKNRKY